MNSINYYTDIFKVTPEQMRLVTEKALSRGGDYSDLYFEYTHISTCSLRTVRCHPEVFIPITA